MQNPTDLPIFKDAAAALKKNDLGGWTRPTPGLYPHQWFWDSCFIAIGLAHLDVGRAQQELRSLLRGQWKNGMLPHVVFSDSTEYHAGPEVWQSHRHPEAPEGIQTTAITQPPMLAEAVIRIARLLGPEERRAWLQEMYEPLVRYHAWLYRERDPYDEGLVFLLHSWESGLDNLPPWMHAIRPHQPLKVRTAEQLNLDKLLDRLRKDTKQVQSSERIRAGELFTLYHLVNRMRRVNYDIERIVEDRNVPLVTDVVFNALLIRANSILAEIALEIDETLPPTLAASARKATHALQTLQRADGSFLNRDFRSRAFINEPSIATFMPLYSGALDSSQAERLVALLRNEQTFWLKHPVPSTPINSAYFTPRRYWQGPTWINMNWLIIDGLRRYGYEELAAEIRTKTLALVEKGGMYEYFSPMDGTGAGSKPFSWTAALTIDLLSEQS